MATSESLTISEQINEEQIPRWKLARRGVQLLINNKADEAQTLFKKYPNDLQMYAGYSFAVFMDALMTFEDDKLNVATAALKEMERRCATDTGWLKSVKSRVFGSETTLSAAEHLECQIILADSQVCLAILTFLQQDLSGYLKGGWVLRKSWKVYQHAYSEIRNLYREIVGELPDAIAHHHSTPPHQAADDEEPGATSDSSGEWDFPEEPATFSSTSPSNGKAHDIDKETITRLMSAVSFGFGLFHLGISLLPPSLLKITNFFGFGGNRQMGISNLMYARQGTDMRAPLATLSLLWYHTIVRPFYALDGSNVQAGVRAASQLLDESQEEYGDSALFLFFRGRVYRLNSDIPSALKAFQASVDNSTQREIKILSLHEVGWCHLIQLDYPAAEHTFQLLKLSSRWSRSFYAYLAAICSGSCDNLKDFSVLKETINLFENAPKGSQLELFLFRRFRCCPKDEEELSRVDRNYWRMFVYELLYLWNTLPSCSYTSIANIIADCQSIVRDATSEPMLGISQLIEGICHYIIKQYEDAVHSFRKCLEVRKLKPYNAEDAHVSAFAQYELGSMLIKNIETKEEGKTLLTHMSHYKDYDFEQRLNVRIHSILKNV
ncbi:hypothetical protein ILUMI_12944 [Ignelater luminosus]|uniref:Tetratricopeptide repeat protein 39C n=1 Tax=Ignelater luminosus TaxID=2038154 RepID=A0A8K0CT84_IGNLU|nr:hypothetical protein ILUMI_12944 [Ignelater luminosus]